MIWFPGGTTVRSVVGFLVVAAIEINEHILELPVTSWIKNTSIISR